MADHHQLVEEIRAFAQSSDQTRTPQLDELARGFAEACAAINARLNRCQRLLKQGLRSEAIQLADAEPKLLDAVAALDFPERPEWDELAGVYGLPAAQPISMEAAGFLNEAYALEDPLRELLRRHRRLALLRAPLVDRIAVLRDLAARDSANPIWTDDQKVFEKARFQRIQAEAAEAAKRQDVAAVGRLLNELEQPRWAEPPPAALLQAMRKTDAQLRGKRTRAALAELESELNDAFSLRDAFRARDARRRWELLVNREQIPAEDPLQVRTKPIFAWLHEEDLREETDRDHEAAQQELISALDAPGRVVPAELERLGNAVLRHGRGMSESIRDQFLDRLRRERASVATRNKRLMGAAAVAACLLLGTGIVFARRQARLNDATTAANALADMVELGEITNATDFLKHLEEADPSLLQTPTLLQAREKFASAREKEDARQLKFGEAMRDAEHADLALTDPPAIKTARDLAKLETEKQAVDALVKRRAGQLATEQARQDQELSPKLVEIDQKLGAIHLSLGRDDFSDNDHEPLTRQIAEAQAALNAMANDIRLSGEATRTRSAALSTRLEGARSRLEKRRGMWRLEHDLTTALDGSAAQAQAISFERFARTMETYAKTYPDESRARAFATTVKERPFWDAIAAWNTQAAAWKSDEQTLTIDRAKARVDECVAFQKSHAGFPQLDRTAEYLAYLEAIVRRDGAKGNARNRLSLLFSDPLVDPVWMIKYKDPQKPDAFFYLSKPPQEEKNLISYLVGFDGQERVRSVVKQFVVSSDWSPQTKVARKFKAILADDSIVTGWNEIMLGLLDSIIKTPDIDPILRIALMRKVCDSGASGSVPLARALDPLARRLKDGDIDVNVPWMDPGSNDADRARSRAKLVIESLAPDELTNVRARLKTLQADFDRLAAGSFQTVGWLRWDNANWRLQPSSSSPIQEDADLWVAMPKAEGKSVWEKAGAVKGGAVQISGLQQTTLAEGRPVFIRRDR